MIFQSIDNTPLKDLSSVTINEFLTDHIFFRFMESGRLGLRSGCMDAIDTLITWNDFNGNLPEHFKEEMQNDETNFNKLVDMFTKMVTNAFITQGTQGIKNSLNEMLIYFYNANN